MADAAETAAAADLEDTPAVVEEAPAEEAAAAAELDAEPEKPAEDAPPADSEAAAAAELDGPAEPETPAAEGAGTAEKSEVAEDAADVAAVSPSNEKGTMKHAVKHGTVKDMLDITYRKGVSGKRMSLPEFHGAVEKPFMLAILVNKDTKNEKVMAKNEEDETPLEYAIYNESWEGSYLLVKKLQSEIEKKGLKKYNAAIRLAYSNKGWPDLAKKKNEEVRNKALWAAIANSGSSSDANMDAIELLYCDDVNPNDPDPEDEGRCALHKAAMAGNLLLTAVCLDKGASFLATDNGEPVPRWAIDDCIDDEGGESGKNPRPHCAYLLAKRFCKSILEMKGKYKKPKADPAKTKEVMAALLEAIATGDLWAFLRAVHRDHVDVNWSDPTRDEESGAATEMTGKTPLHLAAARGDEIADACGMETPVGAVMVAVLLELGANVTALDGHGNTPLDLATAGQHSVTSLLLSRRINYSIDLTLGKLPYKLYSGKAKGMFSSKSRERLKKVV